MPALFLGSIGTVAETSELQRQSFNAAFAEAGLSWTWSPDSYRAMLGQSGGRDRIAGYAARKGQKVDVDALHARKSDLFREALSRRVPPRPGVIDTLAMARRGGWSVAFVTTTGLDNVTRILSATGIAPDQFDLILDRTRVETGKPAPECYRLALKRLKLTPEEAIAVEDNPGGLRAAKSAGLRCVAFPGACHDLAASAEADDVLTDTLHLPVSVSG